MLHLEDAIRLGESRKKSCQVHHSSESLHRWRNRGIDVSNDSGFSIAKVVVGAFAIIIILVSSET